MAVFSSTQPSLRVRILPRFPAQVLAGNGMTITKSGGTYTFEVSATLGATDFSGNVAIIGDLFVDNDVEIDGDLNVDGGLDLNETLDAEGRVHASSDSATPAGGDATIGFRMGQVEIGIYFGSGAPTLAAVQGSLYLRTDGSATNNRAYINTNGATTWTALTTVA